MKDIPRTIDPANTFNALVDWFYNLIVKHNAPGFLIGLSGTDSVVSFLAASKAIEKADRPERVLGVHFAPSEDFIDDYPDAQVHLWFSEQIVPWLRTQVSKAKIVVDDISIDWRCDGLRWGTLADMSVVNFERTRSLRLPEDQYWIVGTRNRSEDVLLTYSNASMLASLQPLIHLWKSEVLQLSEYLQVPKVAITKSCETDCICGRMSLPARHIREVDTLLMVRCGELTEKYAEENIPADLNRLLGNFIKVQISKSQFKKHIPYTPDINVVCHREPLVAAFEDGTLNLSEFNHRKHLYVAWCYLKAFRFDVALVRYTHYLGLLLDSAGQSNRFSLDITRSHFERLDNNMKLYPSDSFDDLVLKQ